MPRMPYTSGIRGVDAAAGARRLRVAVGRQTRNRMMKRVVILAATGALAVGMFAGPALASHDHQLNNPSGCHTVPVSHQDHQASDPGNKFHGSAHKGPATEQNADGDWILGQGNSRVSVDGGACA